MDVLDLTFDQIRAALRPHPHELKPLRAVYRHLLGSRAAGPSRDAAAGDVPTFPRSPMLAAAAARFAAELRADVAPVIRHVRDGDLTKFVQRLPDGLETESVVVPMPRGAGTWYTLCVSSQVGCARGCVFCETGQLGLLRNLTPGEIVGQVVAAQRTLGLRIRNVVLMGMGEPLDNFDNVIQALRVLGDPSGLSLAGERLTISTVGRCAGIRRLAKLGWRRLNLAVSLNAPNDEIRSQIMPINRLEPLAELRDALLSYPLRNCQYFMMEYVLIPGVNDACEHAKQVADYLRPLKSVLNVIPYNPRHHSPWPAPRDEAVVQFLSWVEAAGQPCKRRVTKGRQHMAACGQLGNRALARS